MIDQNLLNQAAAKHLDQSQAEALFGHPFDTIEQQQWQLANSQTALAPMKLMAKKLPPLWNRYSQEDVEDCISRHYGLVTPICNELDCTQAQLNRAIEKWKLQPIVDEARQQIVDTAEETLVQLMHDADSKIRIEAAKFALKTAGRQRGWSDAPTAAAIQLKSDGPVDINAIFGLPDSTEDKK